MCGLFLDRLIVGDPDWSETQHADLPGVPVSEAVEAEDFVEFAVTPAVPAHAFGATRVGRWRHQLGEDLLASDELQKVRIPGALVIVLLDTSQSLVFEELNGLLHDLR